MMSRHQNRFRRFFPRQLKFTSSIDHFIDLYVKRLLEEEDVLMVEIYRTERLLQRQAQGYIFAPYIPVLLTPAPAIVIHGENENIRSRYALTTVRGFF